MPRDATPCAGGGSRERAVAPSALDELARVQRALQQLIAAPGGRARVDADAARAIGCDAEQIAVVRGMCALRFAREVAREFPATRALLGKPRFDAEARAFLERTASASYTLEGYARAFPRHLARGRGARALPGATELARLEREIASVRAARSGAARHTRPDAIPPSESRAPRLRAAPGARIRLFAWDADAALARFERGEALPAPRRRATRLALFRRGARVARVRLARGEAPLLAALLRGEPLESAVALALGAGLTAPAIGRALERWVREGLLTPARN